ncbi:hypothetical protein [Saliphagus sp. LR7]|uniref:hypothetical protein n=1 Tax=Saliphagus sp. LR7 TaxID=2282654 RepID=UPI001300A258|nr:hypothetical protein [Saliphagus sp. LR7]
MRGDIRVGFGFFAGDHNGFRSGSKVVLRAAPFESVFSPSLSLISVDETEEMLLPVAG